MTRPYNKTWTCSSCKPPQEPFKYYCKYHNIRYRKFCPRCNFANKEGLVK